MWLVKTEVIVNGYRTSWLIICLVKMVKINNLQSEYG